MISSVHFEKTYRCFTAAAHLDLRPGINLLVGDQGTGKSSLIGLLRGIGGDPRGLGPMSVEEARKTVKLGLVSSKMIVKFIGFDFEKDNPRTLSYVGEGALFQVGSIFRSHGQTVRSILGSLEESASKEPYLVLFDEPDAGLSPRSTMDLLRVFQVVVDGGGQVIASVHNPILILGVPEVLSLEHRRWMPGREFLGLHGVHKI